jgi:ABC-type multidrug transport system ATPase subunit
MTKISWREAEARIGIDMLEIRSLDKTYNNGVHALNDVNLEVPKGMYGLLGPNGAGKSTLMRTIAALQAPDSGTIRLGDIDVQADPASLRKKLGYLPQEFGVYPRTSPLTLLEHVAVLKGITDRGQRKGLVERLLVQTNLWDVRKKNMTTFSGGMKQRIGIAQALIGDPELIIVDEPTAGLDPVERRRFHNLLSEIGEDVVVILSTHIVEDVADLCPRMAIMASGRILEEGQPAQLVAALEGKLWRRIVGPQDAGATEADVLSRRRVAGQIELKVHADAAPDGFEPAPATLEDVYFVTLAQAGVDIELD